MLVFEVLIISTGIFGMLMPAQLHGLRLALRPSLLITARLVPGFTRVATVVYSMFPTTFRLLGFLSLTHAQALLPINPLW